MSYSEPKDQCRSHNVLWIGLATVSVCVAVLVGNRSSTTGSDQGVVIVPASTQPADSTAIWYGRSKDTAGRPSVSPTFEPRAVEQFIARTLPVLQDVHAECDSTSCMVTAQPLDGAAGSDQRVFERLVTDDIPYTLLQSGYALLEQIQVEEIGPDTNSLRFRIGVKGST